MPVINEVTTAAAILARYWNGNIPIQPADIARQLGIEVCNNLQDRSGEISRHPDGRIVIRCNPTDQLLRQRFTVAHELGHWACGHLGEGVSIYRDDASSFYSHVNKSVEREANQFAAELMMPPEALAWAIKSGRWPSINLLASAFGVSSAAMGYRMQKLGYI